MLDCCVTGLEGGEEGSGDDEDGDSDAEDDDVVLEGSDEELDPKRHPLLQPGAMPRMSKAAMEMAIGMVTVDLTGVDEDDELED